MNEPQDETTGVERGAAEDASGTPVTPTEEAASRRPPGEPGGGTSDEEDEDSGGE